MMIKKNAVATLGVVLLVGSLMVVGATIRKICDKKAEKECEYGEWFKIKGHLNAERYNNI